MKCVILVILFFQIPRLAQAIQNENTRHVPLRAFKPNLFNLALRIGAETKQKMQWERGQDQKAIEDDYQFILDDKAPITPIMQRTEIRIAYSKRPRGVFAPKTVSTTIPTTTAIIKHLSWDINPNGFSLSDKQTESGDEYEKPITTTTTTAQPFVRYVPMKVNVKPRTLNIKKKKKPIKRQPSTEAFYRRELDANLNSLVHGIHCYDITSYVMDKKNKKISKTIDYVVYM